MYYQYGQNCIFGAKFDPEIYKRGILFIGSPGMKNGATEKMENGMEKIMLKTSWA